MSPFTQDIKDLSNSSLSGLPSWKIFEFFFKFDDLVNINAFFFGIIIFLLGGIILILFNVFIINWGLGIFLVLLLNYLKVALRGFGLLFEAAMAISGQFFLFDVLIINGIIKTKFLILENLTFHVLNSTISVSVQNKGIIFFPRAL